MLQLLLEKLHRRRKPSSSSLCRHLKSELFTAGPMAWTSTFVIATWLLELSEHKLSYWAELKTCLYLIYCEVNAGVRKNSQHVWQEATVEHSHTFSLQDLPSTVQCTWILTSSTQNQASLQHLNHKARLTFHSILITDQSLAFNQATGCNKTKDASFIHSLECWLVHTVLHWWELALSVPVYYATNW